VKIGQAPFHGNGSKIWGNGSIWKFWKKAETDQKYEETDQKLGETNQQIEIFKVFEKSGNGSKKAETDQKF